MLPLKEASGSDVSEDPANVSIISLPFIDLAEISANVLTSSNSLELDSMSGTFDIAIVESLLTRLVAWRILPDRVSKFVLGSVAKLRDFAFEPSSNKVTSKYFIALLTIPST